MNTILDSMFFWGFIGSLMFEIVILFGNINKSKEVPKHVYSLAYWIIAFLIATMAGALTVFYEVTTRALALSVGMSTPLIVDFFKRQTQRQKEIKEIQEGINEGLKGAEKAVREHPGEVRPVWERARFQLESYINRNLFQINLIFGITVLVMVVGFFLVGLGVYKAIAGVNINVAIVATSSGILTEFIGATFLFIYRSALNQASDYVRTLERINAVGMSVQIMESISVESTDLKNQTKAELVKNILDAFPRSSNK